MWVSFPLESERTWNALIHTAPWNNNEWFLRLGSKRPSSFHLVCGNTCCWNSALPRRKSDHPRVAMIMRHSGEDTWGGLDVIPRRSSEPQPPASSWLRHQMCKEEILGKPRPHPLKSAPAIWVFSRQFPGRKVHSSHIDYPLSKFLSHEVQTWSLVITKFWNGCVIE